MTTFDDRENAFENKFAHDAETRFRVQARAVKYLAQWAAALLGRPADAYTAELISTDFRQEGQDDVVEKLVFDLAGHADEPAIRARLAQALDQAQKDVTGG